MPRRRSGKMLQLGDYSFYAPVARGPSISPAALTRAFNKTQSSTTDIVSRAGFIGYTEQVYYPRILEICRNFVVDAFRKRKCDIRRLSEGQAISPICMGDDATMAQYLSCMALLADRRLGYRPNPATSSGAPRPSRQSRAATARCCSSGTTRGSRPSPACSSTRASASRSRGPGRRTPSAPSPPRPRAKGPWRNRAPTNAPAPPSTASWRTSSAASSTRTTLRGRTLTLGGPQHPRAGRRPGLDGRVSYRLYDKEAGLLEDVREAFGGKYGIIMFNTRGVDEPPRPGEEGSQDIVVAVNAAHAAADKVGCLRSVKRHLRPYGGVALVLEVVQEECCWGGGFRLRVPGGVVARGRALFKHAAAHEELAASHRGGRVAAGRIHDERREGREVSRGCLCCRPFQRTRPGITPGTGTRRQETSSLRYRDL
ncbi:Non-reducing polyketide synthase SAT8 [Colletotrichum sidae]|uniref:Non-reducing polyketide synthase SAT8 n=1 Tax=Colletotrichum sidae TaxID=1347389 RepID=A0A4R8TC83_9PEZI|nr:Non-reducing polyketide synthase SAT8 [Colletotrichum sidae]